MQFHPIQRSYYGLFVVFTLSLWTRMRPELVFLSRPRHEATWHGSNSIACLHTLVNRAILLFAFLSGNWFRRAKSSCLAPVELPSILIFRFAPSTKQDVKGPLFASLTGVLYCRSNWSAVSYLHRGIPHINSISRPPFICPRGLTLVLTFLPIPRDLLGNMISGTPVEIWAKIFRSLYYPDLLVVSAVCRLWNSIAQSDPHLLRLTFKNKTEATTDVSDTLVRFYSPKHVVPSLTRSQLHPALSQITYNMGDAHDTAGFFMQSSTAIQAPEFRALQSFSIANHFATIPHTIHMDIAISQTFSDVAKQTSKSPILYVSVHNLEGIRIIDIFKGISKASVFETMKQ